MGVISLLGDGQARRIEDELIERIGPEEIDKRKLLCGDAYSFQGDERDVMYLSLVVAPVNLAGDRSLPRAVTAKQFKQRYNVAASRARDQMWLFHSVMPGDLSPLCLRRNLLEYCLDPKIEVSEVLGLDLRELNELARTANRDQLNIPPPFRSWFEVDVFLKVANRGYRVVPEFQVHGRFIDLVVEGMRGRLAVECA